MVMFPRLFLGLDLLCVWKETIVESLRKGSKAQFTHWMYCIVALEDTNTKCICLL